MRFGSFSSSRFRGDVFSQRGREAVGHGHRDQAASRCCYQGDCAGCARGHSRGPSFTRRLIPATERFCNGNHPSPYPLRLTGELSPQLSRGLWLVKWLLAIPHFIVLFFLWIAYRCERHRVLRDLVHRSLSARAVRVQRRRPSLVVARRFYSYSALGTDRYPPFTLDDVSDYPARLEVDYPESLSRGLVLVKWCTRAAAVPDRRGVHRRRLGHLDGDREPVDLELRRPDRPAGAIRRRHPAVHRPLSEVALRLCPRDEPLGVRVAAYATLMTDSYPPFRLDAGGEEPPTATHRRRTVIANRRLDRGIDAASRWLAMSSRA